MTEGVVNVNILIALMTNQLPQVTHTNWYVDTDGMLIQTGILIQMGLMILSSMLIHF